MHPALASTRPLVFAHRGGSKLAPENTMAAFDRGMAAGADGLELDVRLSRDGVAVVHHDPLIDRTTRGQGPLGARTAVELAELNVPTLREVLARHHGARVIIELKESRAELARAVIDEVHRAGAVNNVCLGSFDAGVLRIARRIDARVATSGGRTEVRLALYRSWINLSPGRTPYQAFQVPEVSGSTRVVSPRFVKLAHKAGIVVQVWTVDEPGDIRRLLDWGVDGIITDRPDTAVKVLGEWMGGQSSVGSR
jgi:glycerophosphoryl diester phosphodiesterase